MHLPMVMLKFRVANTYPRIIRLNSVNSSLTKECACTGTNVNSVIKLQNK